MIHFILLCVVLVCINIQDTSAHPHTEQTITLFTDSTSLAHTSPHRTTALDSASDNDLLEENLPEEPLKVFGTMQTFLFLGRIDNAFLLGRPGANINQRTFALQQLDVFLRKDLGNDFSFFADIEFLLNYDSQLNFGGLSIQEAYANYQYSSAFNVKAGILFPAFNGMNEIKNRLGILPYIIRPLAYERSLAVATGASEIVPDRAFLQLYGTKRIHSLLFDYAFYMGNADNAYLTTNSNRQPFDLFSGTNPPGVSFHLVGTRLGIRNTKETFKAGLSFSYDRAPFFPADSIQNNPRLSSFQGDFPRLRLGSDISFTWGNFWFESEFIKVLYDSYTLKSFPDIQHGRTFGYTTFGYNASSRWTLYVLLQWLGGDNVSFISTPQNPSQLTPINLSLQSNSASIGVSYRVNNGIALKAQFQNTSFENEVLSVATSKLQSDLTQFLLGITVNF